MKAIKLFVVMMLALLVGAVGAHVTYADVDTDLEVISIDIGDYDDAQDIFTEDGDEALVFERGEAIPIKVRVKNTAVVPDGEDEADYVLEDVEIEAKIFGYRYNQVESDKISDTTRPFDLDVGEVSNKGLDLEVPVLHPRDDVKLRIIVGTSNGVIKEYTYQLNVDGVDESKAIQIKDYVFTPDEVVVGRAFTGIVKVKNIGDDDLDDLKVTVSIPELDISDSEFMEDDLEADDTAKFEELLLRIPFDADEGTYDVEIEVEFDEYESVTETTTIEVVAERQATPSSEAKTIISVPNNQELTAGTTAVYPIKIANIGDEAKTYALSVSGIADWATYKMDPSAVVVVDGDSSKTVLLSIAASETATSGAKSFTVTVESGSERKDVSMTATVAGGEETANQWDRVKRGLEIALVVLVIILIIIGLIIGFNKLRDSGNKDEEAQTYY